MKKKAIEQQHRTNVDKTMPSYGTGGPLGNQIFEIINNEIAPNLILTKEELQKPETKQHAVQVIHNYMKKKLGEKYEENKGNIDDVILKYFNAINTSMGGLKPAGSSLKYKKYILSKSMLDIKSKK
jgi:hypothetical protein